MCTGFTTDGICINTICAVSLGNHLRAVADAFNPLRTHYHYTIKMHKTMETELSHETVLRNSVPRHKDVH